MNDLKRHGECFAGNGPAQPGVVPLAFQWDALEVLASVERHHLRVADERIAAFRDDLWEFVCEEYDAEHLCQFLREKKIALSDDFKFFEHYWRRDELNHTAGFVRLYSLLYGDSTADLVRRLRARKADFSEMEHLLKDEFSVLVVLAYDEIATTRAYIADREFYEQFNLEAFRNWSGLLVRDEVCHFKNCISALKRNYAGRVPEIEEALDRIIAWEAERHGYKATFVLDHHTSQYTAEFLDECRNLALRPFRVNPETNAHTR